MDSQSNPFGPMPSRQPVLTEAELAELLDRVCPRDPLGKGPRTQLGLWLPSHGEWKAGAFGAIDASPALMAMMGKKVIYPVAAGERADSHYYLQLVERNDGVHDLYLRYQVILGQRLLGGLTDEQVTLLRDRFHGRAPLPLLTRVDPASMLPAVSLDATSATGTTKPSAAPAAPAPAPARTAREPAALPAAAAAGARRIDDVVLQVLRAGRTEDTRFYLGPERLDPKLYQRVNVVLQDLGGKWKSGRTQAHVFEGPADEALAAALASGEYLTAKDFGFFPTPGPLADRAIAAAGLRPGMKVLEPSAGHGSLALRAAAIVGMANVTACEYLERNVAKLRAAGLVDVNQGDFLAMPAQPVFDAVVLNPPFGNLQDIKHVAHAARFVKPDGVLVAIMSPSWQTRDASAAAGFRDFAEASLADVQAIPAGAFRESGTDVATVLVRIDACNFPWNQTEALAEVDQTDDADASADEALLEDLPRG